MTASRPAPPEVIVPDPSRWRFSGAEVARRRRAAGIEGTPFAAAIGRSAAQLSRYEAGDYIPPLELVVAMAAALGCEPGELFEPIDATAESTGPRR